MHFRRQKPSEIGTIISTPRRYCTTAILQFWLLPQLMGCGMGGGWWLDGEQGRGLQNVFGLMYWNGNVNVIAEAVKDEESAA